MPKDARMTAAIAQQKHYRGAPCKKNPDHGRTRYTSSGQCVKCLSVAATARNDKIRGLLKGSQVADSPV